MKKREIQLVVAVYPLLYLGGVARGTELMDATWQAICWVESRNDPNAYNAAEDAAGVAQIRPCYLRDANEQVGAPVFGLSDRYDPEASRAMFGAYIERYCPKGGPEQWARTHNGGPRGPQKEFTLAYWRKVRQFPALAVLLGKNPYTSM
jgi:hypothetical protein